MKTLWLLVKIGVGAIAVLFLCVFLVALWGYSTADAGKAMAGLVRIEHMQMSDRKITGHLVNLGADRLASVTLQFNTYTKDGARVGEAFDSINRLSGHEHWAFTAYTESRAGQCALSEIRINGMRVPLADMAISYLADEEKAAKAARLAEWENGELKAGELKAAKAARLAELNNGEFQSNQTSPAVHVSAKSVEQIRAEAKATREAQMKAAVEKFRAEQAAKKEP